MKALLVLLVLFVGSASARDSFRYRCPRGDSVLPASCLENMRVRDVSRTLTRNERHRVAYLFLKSYAVSIVRYQQDYLLKPEAPIFRLLVTNFPEAAGLEGEGGVFLRRNFELFKTKPNYRVDIARVLREFPKLRRLQQPGGR